MERIEKLRSLPAYQQEYDRLRRMEQGRAFCSHDMEHFLDVARVCWILTLEQNLSYDKEVVYAAGLLHDIGKGLQYEFGTPHHTASADLARAFMPQCGYSPEETELVADAILHHRKKDETVSPLARMLYQADKQTRLCFCCSAQADCNWPEEKRTGKVWY